MKHVIPFWFIVITVLWTGFFVLEGFDFGVGMLHGVVGQDEAGRRAAINTIGPLWDGNEVWLIVAAAAMFAAFPGWYATMFSGFYLALVLLLASLIVRGVSFEYRGKRDALRWRRTWDVLLTVGSLLAPLLIGVALGDLLHGLPINSSQEYTGSFWDLLQPYGLFTGVTLVLICLLHGATFLGLKTTGDMHERAGQLARRVAPLTGAAVVAFVIWTHVTVQYAPSLSTRSNCSPCSPSSPPSGWSTSAATASRSPRPRSRWRPASCRSSSACIPTSWSPAPTRPTTSPCTTPRPGRTRSR